MICETSRRVASVSSVLHRELVLTGLDRAGNDLILIQIECRFTKDISEAWRAATSRLGLRVGLNLRGYTFSAFHMDRRTRLSLWTLSV